jgi:triosephosphate isomerase
VCIGEDEKERERGETFLKIENQLKCALEGLKPEQISRIVIAYEPIWAIGTGKSATPSQAQEVHIFIRRWLKEKFGGETAMSQRILYGGSVTPENIKDLMNQEDIDGVLVGGASLDSMSFVKIANYNI